MTLLEAMEARHSVRKYTDAPIPEDVLATLRNRVWEINREAGLHVQLVTDEPKAFGGFKSTSGVFSYGAFTVVRNYFVIAGKKGDDLDEKVGYWGEQLVLLPTAVNQQKFYIEYLGSGTTAGSRRSRLGRSSRWSDTPRLT